MRRQSGTPSRQAPRCQARDRPGRGKGYVAACRSTRNVDVFSGPVQVRLLHPTTSTHKNLTTHMMIYTNLQSSLYGYNTGLPYHIKMLRYLVPTRRYCCFAVDKQTSRNKCLSIKPTERAGTALVWVASPCSSPALQQ